MQIEHQTEVFADHFQFMIEDRGLGTVDIPADWGHQLADTHMATAPRWPELLGVGTARNRTVPVVVALHDTAPPFDDAAEHVVEGGVDVPSGNLLVRGTTGYDGSAFTLAVEPGHFRVRASSFGLDTLSADQRDGEDHYRVEVWPAPPGPVIVHRQVHHAPS